MKFVFIGIIIALVVFYFIKSTNKTKEAAKNIELGQQFLLENKNDSGVIETKSGLQYVVLVKGDGDKHPIADSTVRVHYHGTLLDGSVFDSSVERGEPISFPLNRVIKGWTEGVQLMVVGDKFKFFIPSELAYGNSSAGIIPPGATLVFDVELLAIE